ncbi:HPr kinase/phosphorylase [Pleomorphomonas sp. NRK KF1]|uniref:HPr kinase/phosphorylase n=1 Tax=Pleomorphomonas sp. NRK KF1 TaxID=2943000 RepID=UPI002043CD01|nr:serine/threonine protein kinase [Pleomorphomonas sp. NRK KF1]MCM5553064.1 serine/threonine protein kinase [Pleomorphomonas sp. NRK KF1]
MTPPTVHATAVVIGEAGLLIRGASGAGKTSLAFALVEEARRKGVYAAFVADDRVALSCVNGRIVARCPETISGLAERRGRGVERVDHVPAAVIRLVADLVDPEAVARLPEIAEEEAEIDGVKLPRQAIPTRQTAVSLPLLDAALAEMNKI